MSRFPNDFEKRAQEGTRAMQLENLKIDDLFKAHMEEAFSGPPGNREPGAKLYTWNDMLHAFSRGWHASKHVASSIGDGKPIP